MPAAHQQRRMVSMQEITKNLHLVTQTPRDVAHDPKTLRYILIIIINFDEYVMDFRIDWFSCPI